MGEGYPNAYVRFGWLVNVAGSNGRVQPGKR